MRELRSGLVMVLVLTVGACGEPDVTPNLGFSVRDSAGVRMVESGRIGEGPWHVSSEPLFSVGWDEQGPQFTWVRSGRILRDGGALIGDYGTGTVIHVGPDGAVVETWGRKGEGPGEYQGLDAILLKGDSVVVSDSRLRRVTIRSPTGAIRTAPLPSGLICPVATSLLSDDRVLVLGGECYGAVGQISPEWVFHTQPIELVSLADGTVDSIAELPHLRRWHGDPGGSPGAIHVKGGGGGFSGGFAWARSDQARVQWYSAVGELLQVASWEEDLSPLTDEWQSDFMGILEEAYRDQPPEFVSAQLSRLEGDLDRYEGPLPYWDQVHVDRAGNVWLSDYPLPMQPPGRWRAVSGEGQLVGWIDLPGVISVLDITDDRVLAMSLSELDVAAVQMYELIKP